MFIDKTNIIKEEINKINLENQLMNDKYSNLIEKNNSNNLKSFKKIDEKLIRIKNDIKENNNELNSKLSSIDFTTKINDYIN